jgi:nitroimidazol reductase NimA-like FMN-containing flavoprotein (pyridoxamine 5'-phosphate oxidase superfamily)
LSERSPADLPPIPPPAPLSAAELQAFLLGPWVARFALVDAQGFPHVVPLIYDYDGRDFWIVASERVRFAPLVEHHPRCALSIAEDAPPYRRALVKGLAEVVERPNLGGRWVEHVQRMADRYGHPRGHFERTLVYPRWLLRVVPQSIVALRGFRYQPSDRDRRELGLGPPV